MNYAKIMIITDFIDIPSIYLFLKNQVAQCVTLVILLLSLLLSYYLSVASGILLILVFASGVLAFNAVLTSKIIDTFPIFDTSNYSPNYIIQTSAGCTVCGDSQCKRQKAVKDTHPWLCLNIPKDVDQAIQDLLNKILNEFVSAWHSKFTKDESFIYELRRCLRYPASILLKRLLQVDIGEIITDQLITTGLRHVNDYINISKLAAKENICIDLAAVKYLNKRLHPAIISRKSELQYLRCLSESLSDYLVQKPQLQCLSFKALIRELLAGWVLLPLTDTLCDPFIINSLLLLLFNHEPLTEYPIDAASQVQFLQKFVNQSKDFTLKKSVLHSNLSTILKDQKLLYTFMQFLKKNGEVHVLQFCLDVEEISKKILNPELSQSEMENLYKETRELFSIYFKPDSPDSIHFPKHIVQQMEQVLECGASNIGRLRTNPALFKAYEVAYSILEETYCPLFYISDEYFPLLCGERHSGQFSKGANTSPVQPGSPIRGRYQKKTSELNTVSKLTSKFNKLLQFQAIEGRAYFEDAPIDLAEAECAEELQIESQSQHTHRDMSTWKIAVPCVTLKQDSNSKTYPVFTINVTDLGAKEDGVENSKLKWTVERRLNDFYNLQAKLWEFHGEFEDKTQLPPKTGPGLFSSRGAGFLESRRQLFQEYLQKLLQKPNLKGSYLLYLFLHSSEEFSSCLSVPDGIGKMIRKSVEPIKLRKERGQHLENFLNIFLASIEGTKKSGKYEWQDVGMENSRQKRNITLSIYSNNFGEIIEKTGNMDFAPNEALILVGPWDCLLYTMSKLMGASPSTIQTTITLKNLLGQSADLIIKKLIRNKLVSILVPGRISHLVRLLQDALFNSQFQPGKQGHENLKEKVLLKATKSTNNFLIQWLLPDCSAGIEKIVDSLQSPKLNKHLCYCLLDEIIRILFPELATSK